MSAQKATGPDRANDQPRQDQNNQVEIIGAAESLSKRETSLIAAFALRGVAVHRLADGGYICCQWTHTRHCLGLRELAAFARQMGVL